MPIPATATLSASRPDTDTAGSGSPHQTPDLQSSGGRIHAPTADLWPGIADNCKDAPNPDHRFVPCTAGLNPCARVVSASDLQGKLSQNWSRGGLRSRPLTLKTELSRTYPARAPLSEESKNGKNRLVGDTYQIQYAAVILTFQPVTFSRTSKHSHTLNLRKRPCFS